MSEKYTPYPYTYAKNIDMQYGFNKNVSFNNFNVAASKSEIDKYMNPNNSMTGAQKFQHMVLSKVPSNITADTLNNFLKGKGILEGHGQAFITAGNTYNINPVYLLYHAVHETGNGTSALARGTVSGYSGYYNVYGINQKSETDTTQGASYAKSHGWNSVDKAIIGGAEFIRDNYTSTGKDTLYKMKWNPKSPGAYQYAKDVGWAYKQASSINANVGNILNQVSLDYDYPVYSDVTPIPPSIEGQGNLIVTEAKKHIGKGYATGATGPDKFSNSGYVYYVYKTTLNIELPTTVSGLTQEGTKVGYDKDGNLLVKAGDLLFFSRGPSETTDDFTPMPKQITHVGIATGKGGEFIQCSGTNVNIMNLDNAHVKTYFMSASRLLSEKETFNTGGSVSGIYTGISQSGSDTSTGLAGGLPLTNVNRYYDDMISALEELKEKGWDKGTLVDLTNDGSFEFYLPSDITSNNSVNYESSSIKGRSAPLQGYETTGPRSIDVSLTLAAGIKPYDTGDMVDRMHKDINFVESLLYPDYSSAYVLPPATVLLSLGPDIRVKGVMTNFSKNYKAPLDEKGRYMICDISFTITQVTDDPPDYTDIRNATPRSY